MNEQDTTNGGGGAVGFALREPNGNYRFIGYYEGRNSASPWLPVYLADGAATERERCALLCESLAQGIFTTSQNLSQRESELVEFVTRSTAEQLAAAIRKG